MIKVELIFANNEAEKIKKALIKKYGEGEDTPLDVLCETAVLREAFPTTNRTAEEESRHR